jgi:hypothetical protein
MQRISSAVAGIGVARCYDAVRSPGQDGRGTSLLASILNGRIRAEYKFSGKDDHSGVRPGDNIPNFTKSEVATTSFIIYFVSKALDH